ncbi:MAG: hypothetical protein ACREPP_03505 [Rhodanobacteraceae bacterium]
MQRLIWVFLALLPGIAFADNLRNRVEASTVVTGWVEVAPNGSVYNYTLDQPDKLDAGVVDLIAKTIGTWEFKPILVDGKSVLAKAKMNLRVVASPIGNEQYNLRVSGRASEMAAERRASATRNRFRRAIPCLRWKPERAAPSILLC